MAKIKAMLANRPAPPRAREDRATANQSTGEGPDFTRITDSLSPGGPSRRFAKHLYTPRATDYYPQLSPPSTHGRP